jgi:hypothetical protein
VLFLDVLKSWPTNDLITRRLFAQLIVGRSIVVQQDELYACVPWINITMQLFGDHFERLDSVGYGSAVYRLVKPLPDLETMRLSRDLSARQKMTLMDRAISAEAGEAREMLRLSRLILVRYLYGRKAAAADLRAWRARVEMTEALKLALDLTLMQLDGEETAAEAAHHAVRWPGVRRAWRARGAA